MNEPRNEYERELRQKERQDWIEEAKVRTGAALSYADSVRCSAWVGPEEERRAQMRWRRERMQAAADKMGISLIEYSARITEAGRALRKWHEALNLLGYKAGEDPVAFLRRVNDSHAEQQGPTVGTERA